MQPENQPGAPLPPAPQAPQSTPPRPQPVQQATPVMQPQPLQVQHEPIQQPVAQTVYQPASAPQPQQIVQPQPAPVAPVQQITPAVAPDVLGGVAVADQIEGGYGYADDQEEEYDEEIDLSQPVAWQAKEYIHQDKGAKWFIGFAVVIILFLAVAILLMKSISFAVLLVVIGVVIVVFAKRPPRVMEYALSEDGLHIYNTLHRYDDFKSFGVIRDGEEFSVMLIPRRRFQPGITVYFPEEAGEDIVDVLGSRLPMRDLNLDVVDKLVRKLRL